jgi:hypothetical protein
MIFITMCCEEFLVAEKVTVRNIHKLLSNIYANAAVNSSTVVAQQKA